MNEQTLTYKNQNQPCLVAGLKTVSMTNAMNTHPVVSVLINGRFDTNRPEIVSKGCTARRVRIPPSTSLCDGSSTAFRSAVEEI